MALDAAGRIVLAGSTFTGTTPARRMISLRCGSVLAGPSTPRSAPAARRSWTSASSVPRASAIAVQLDGSVLVAGWCTSCGPDRLVVARVTRDGALDPTFGTSGRAVVAFGVNEDKAYAMATRPRRAGVDRGFLPRAGGGLNLRRSRD